MAGRVPTAWSFRTFRVAHARPATADKVRRRAVEAVRLWAEDALADGETLPKPRSVEALRRDTEVAAALAHGAVLAFVPLLRDAGESQQ